MLRAMAQGEATEWLWRIRRTLGSADVEERILGLRSLDRKARSISELEGIEDLGFVIRSVHLVAWFVRQRKRASGYTAAITDGVGADVSEAMRILGATSEYCDLVSHRLAHSSLVGLSSPVCCWSVLTCQGLT